MRHDCGLRGCYLEQLPPWDDYIECFPRNIRPTDVDGMVEIDGRFLFMEEKQAGVPLQTGQRIALRRLADFHGITVVIFRPGVTADLEVLIYDGSPPQGFQPYTRDQFKSWLTNWALGAPEAAATDHHNATTYGKKESA